MDRVRHCEELIETLAVSLNLAPDNDSRSTETTLREVERLWRSKWGKGISAGQRLAMLALAAEFLNSDRVRKELAGPLARSLAHQDLPARDSLIAAVSLWSIGKSNEHLEARALAHARTAPGGIDRHDRLTCLYARRVVCLFSTDWQEILALLDSSRGKCGVVETLNLIGWGSHNVPPKRALKLVNGG
jgi:hypothetical protein